jgi:hypothetical protein
MGRTRLGVLVESRYRDAGAERGIKNLGKAGEEASRGVKKSGDSAGFLQGNLNKLIAGGLLLTAGRQLLAFAQSSVQTASDVDEMRSKFNVVFRETAETVTRELDAMAEATNRSRFDLMGFAATLQDTFVPLGFAREEAASMSVQLVQLATDLASFNNLRTEDVVRDLQSALVGNTETLRKYGVVAQEAQIKQQALEMGLWDGKGAVDANSKAQAILALTISGTADAQGDAARTADSYENVSKGLESAITDLKVAIGDGLIPTLTEAKVEATNVVAAFADFWSASNLLKRAQMEGLITQGDYIKQQAALTFGTDTAADATARMIPLFEEQAAATAEATAEAQMWASVAGSLAGDIAEVAEETTNLVDLTEMGEEGFNRYTNAQRDARRAAIEGVQAQKDLERAEAATNERTAQAIALALELAEAQRQMGIATGDAFARVLTAEAGANLLTAAIEDLGSHTFRVSNLTNEQKASLDELSNAHSRAADTIRSLQSGTRGLSLTEEERAEAIAEQVELMGELEQAMGPLQGITESLVTTNTEAAISMEAVLQSLFDQALASEADATALGLLGVATGQLTEKQAQAAVKAAILKVEIGNLVQAYVDNRITAEEATTAARTLGSGYVETAEDAIQLIERGEETRAKLMEASGAADALKTSLDNIPRNIKVKVSVVTTHEGGGEHGGFTRQHGGPVGAGGTYLVGESGPELFVPNAQGRIIPNNEINQFTFGDINIGGGTTEEMARGLVDRVSIELARRSRRRIRSGL